MDHVKLFIPGPIEVSKRTLEAMTRPLIGHRGKEFEALYSGLQPRLRDLFGTARPVYLSTSSAWGVMEGALRNLVQGRVLCCMNGAFSDKWHDVALRCGKDAGKLQVEWGEPITPDALRAALSGARYDALTLIHNETSTGTMSPIADICAMMRAEFPDVLTIVDTVSSFSALPIPFDELGIDVMLTGSQKALALPPGLSLFAVSPRALDRAKTIPGRGYYFDFVEFEKNAEKNNTPSTPCISLLYALEDKLAQIFEEGVDNRHKRHAKNNSLLRDWVAAKGFKMFPCPGAESRSLICVHKPENVDIPAFVKNMKDRHKIAINGGYGKIKGLTFRVSNMGDETPETIAEVIRAMDDSLPPS